VYKRYLYFILLVGLTVAPSAFSAENLAADFTDRIGNWTATGPAAKEKIPDQYSAIFTEAGVQDSWRRTYAAAGHSLELTITSFRDPTGAYQAFTFQRFQEMPGAALTETSAVKDGRALLLVGNFLVRAEGLAQETAAADLKFVVARLKPHADASPFPPIRTYLPVKDRVLGTDLYASGPVAFRSAMDLLGQSDYAQLSQEADMTSGAEAIAARYHKGDGDAVLLLIEYPTPQLAEQELHHLEVALAGKLKKNGVTVERKASLLSLVLGSSNPTLSSALRQDVNYETDITWNEPVFTVTEPPIISMVAKIFTGTGVLLLMALVLGVAFGGVRVVTKALFPGKVFDRPDQIEILQLRLSDKKPTPPR
jgi:hypothetical protein